MLLINNIGIWSLFAKYEKKHLKAENLNALISSP